VVVAVLLLLSFAAGRMSDDEPKVFELVAGEGDNYGAKVAPALGEEGGLKVPVVAAPTPEPPKPAPAKVEPTPIAPAPQPVTPKQTPEVKPTPKEEKIPDFKKQLVRAQQKAETKAKREAAKERAAEEKRIEAEKKKMTKAEYDATHKVASAAPAKSAPPKIPKVGEGIATGVPGGSTENKKGGQGGKALKSDNDDVMDAFFAMFKDRVRKNFEAPPGLSDQLEARVQIMSYANGTFSGAKIVKSSGSKEFDDAVMAAAKRVQMAPRPDKKSEPITFTFAMKDLDDR
jgi:colicin import membrane protein